MFRRYCDDCIRRLPIALDECEAQPGMWVGEPKVNGYRLHAEKKNGTWTWWSRKWNKHPISKELDDLLVATLKNFPDETMLDGEWLERRTNVEGVIFWDVMHLDGAWQGEKTYAERRKSLTGLPTVDMNQLRCPFVSITDSVLNDFKAYYEHMTKIDWVEGLVLKRLDSKLIGSVKDRVENPKWIKVKYKGGSTGEKIGVQS